ncbi:MAG: RimK family alpha-L-glutamate ligase [Clostridia bacterium]|nr:RimK family alpha-L-glutamate ligase [Clostridia bacterium]
MLGWFVTSGYFQNESVLYVKDCFKNAFKKHGIDFCHVKSNEKICYINEKGNVVLQGEKPDFVVFWDKDVLFASMMEKLGIKVFNSSKAIEICDDKAKTVVALAERGIAMPKTVVAPLVFSNCNETDEVFINNLEKTLDFPMIVKESSGSFGWQVYLARDRQQLKELRKKLLHVSHLYQQFVSSSSGKDVRVIVVGGKAIASMVRENKNDFRANVELGGSAKYIPVDEVFLRTAEKCANVLGLDYAGVDLLVDKNGLPLVCEVNSNAYFKGMQSVFNVDVADVYLQYILKKL